MSVTALPAAPLPVRPSMRPGASLGARCAVAGLVLAAAWLGPGCGHDIRVLSTDGSGGANGNGGASSASCECADSSSAFCADVVRVDVSLYCDETAPPDPVWVLFVVDYCNTTSEPVQATIVDAEVTLGSELDGLRWSFDVTPPASGSVAAGTSESVPHYKVVDSGTGDSSTPPCAYCDGPATLSLRYAVDGMEPVAASASTWIVCTL